MPNEALDGLFAADIPESIRLDNAVSDDELYQSVNMERFAESYDLRIDDLTSYEDLASSLGYSGNPSLDFKSIQGSIKARRQAKQVAKDQFSKSDREIARKLLVENTKNTPILGTGVKLWANISRLYDLSIANFGDMVLGAASGAIEQVAASGSVGTGAPGTAVLDGRVIQNKPSSEETAQSAKDLVSGIQDIRDQIKVGIDPDLAQTVYGQTVAVATQLTTGMGAMLMNPSLGIAAFESIAFDQAVSEYDEYAKNPNATDRIKFGLTVALPTAALDLVGGERAFAKILSSANPGVRSEILKRLVLSIGKEGLTEGLQGSIMNFMANTEFDQDRELFGKQFLADMLIGMAGAGIVGGAISIPMLQNANIQKVLDMENVSPESVETIRSTVTEDEFIAGTEGNLAQESLMRAMYNGDPGARAAYLQLVEQQAVQDAPPQETETIALNQEEFGVIREELNLTQAPIKDRVTLKEFLNTAKRNSMDANADTLAQEIISKPRALTGEEQASLVIRAAQLKNQYAEAIGKASKASEQGDTVKAFELNEKAEKIISKIDNLVTADDIAGTVISRAFGARRIRISLDDYSLAGLKIRAQAAKGAALTQDEINLFDALSNKIKDSEARIAELENELNTLVDETAPQALKDKLMEERIRNQQLKRSARKSVDKFRKKTKMEYALEIAGLPRSLLATGDMSAVLRQGLLLSVRRPITATKIFGKAFKAFFSQHTADQIDAAIRFDPKHEGRLKANLYLTPMDRIDLAAREESFASTIPEKIPVIREVVLASERHMVATLNMLRTAAFDQFVEAYPNSSLKDRRAFADYINKASGRGNLGKAAGAAQSASMVFFAPRFAISRFQAPFTLIQNFNNPIVAKEIGKDFASMIGVGGTILLLASLAGLEVGTDPEDSDFGKIIAGNTRIDIWGSFQQPARLAMQPFMAGIQQATEGDTDIDVLSAAMNFTKYKLSPSITIPAQLLTGSDVVGQERTLLETAGDSFVPLTIQEALDTMNEENDEIMAGGAFAGAFFGIGVSSFDKE